MTHAFMYVATVKVSNEYNSFGTVITAREIIMRGRFIKFLTQITGEQNQYAQYLWLQF